MTVRLIIIDDEYRIGQLISKLIHQEELGIVTAEVFSRSTDAYEYIVRNHPDIVISDIQMPVMDGLELIRRVKESEADPYFILISGFREFEYARTALKYGVEDYLLKPIKEEELNRVLSEVIRKVSDEAQKKEETERLQKTAEQVHTLKGKEVMDALAAGHDEGSAEAFGRTFQVDFSAACFMPLILQIDHDNPEEREYLQDRFVTNSVISMMEDTCRPSVREQLYSAEDNRRISGILNYDPEDSAPLLEEIKNHFLEIRSHVEVVPGYHITLALGDPCGFEGISTSLCLAEKRIVQRLLSGTGKVIFDTQAESDGRVQGKLSPYDEQCIRNAVLAFSRSELSEIISGVFRQTENYRPSDAPGILSLAVQMIDCFFRSLPHSAENEAEQSRIRKAVDECSSLNMIRNTLIRELGDCLDEQGRTLRDQTGRPVREALDYIGRHYSEKITLESISEMLQMNASYFSTLFKKETGENFQSYLTTLRIEKAKELLRTTNDTMQSIAAQVGYTDTRYFSQSFTKIVGIKPSLYRKMYS